MNHLPPDAGHILARASQLAVKYQLSNDDTPTDYVDTLVSEVREVLDRPSVDEKVLGPEVRGKLKIQAQATADHKNDPQLIKGNEFFLAAAEGINGLISEGQ